jgi:hypothetical protein
MNIRKQIKGLAVGLAALAYAVYPAMCADTINQTGISGFTYTGNDTGQGSANKGRQINSATIANDANNLYISIALQPQGNATSQGGFDYAMVMTSGSPSAGGDTSANGTTLGNAFNAWSGGSQTRAISIDSGFGGMTDMIGIYTSGSSPYTFGWFDAVFSGGSWTVVENQPEGTVTIGNGSGGNPTVLTLTVPLSDLSNLGSTFDFDVASTGDSGLGQTAYGDLAAPGALQGGTYYVNGGTAQTASGTYSATAQVNLTTLDQYTEAVPEPATLALVGLGGLSLMLFRRQRK